MEKHVKNAIDFFHRSLLNFIRMKDGSEMGKLNIVDDNLRVSKNSRNSKTT